MPVCLEEVESVVVDGEEICCNWSHPGQGRSGGEGKRKGGRGEEKTGRQTERATEEETKGKEKSTESLEVSN